MLTRALLLLLLLSPWAEAQTTIEFWHSQDVVEDTILELAEAFNRSQQDYRVVPRYTGFYLESSVRLVSALASGSAPVLFDAESAIFARLVEEGSALDLSRFTDELGELTGDIFPVLWAAGELAGGRYGLPWSLSMPVLVYNASIFKQLELEPPQSWDAFEAVAARLTTRNTTGYIGVAAAFVLEIMVSTRGSALVTEDGRPNFTSPEAVEALSMLARMVQQGHATTYGFGQLDAALMDFVRTKGMMAFAQESALPQAGRFSLAFEVGAAPVPVGSSRAVPVMGGQLVVLRGSSELEQQGAIAFWRFLMAPENVAAWVRASQFLPVRQAALPLLEPWYAENAGRRATLTQLEHAVLRPQLGAYALWHTFLDEAMERAMRGSLSPEAALAEAQRRALATLP